MNTSSFSFHNPFSVNHIMHVKYQTSCWFLLVFMFHVACFNLPTDINECEVSGKTLCDHECVNTVGSFLCRCRTGYILAPDQRSCILVPNCELTYVFWNWSGRFEHIQNIFCVYCLSLPLDNCYLLPIVDCCYESHHSVQFYLLDVPWISFVPLHVQWALYFGLIFHPQNIKGKIVTPLRVSYSFIFVKKYGYAPLLLVILKLKSGLKLFKWCQNKGLFPVF